MEFSFQSDCLKSKLPELFFNSCNLGSQIISLIFTCILRFKPLTLTQALPLIQNY